DLDPEFAAEFGGRERGCLPELDAVAHEPLELPQHAAPRGRVFDRDQTAHRVPQPAWPAVAASVTSRSRNQRSPAPGTCFAPDPSWTRGSRNAGSIGVDPVAVTPPRLYQRIPTAASRPAIIACSQTDAPRPCPSSVVPPRR